MTVTKSSELQECLRSAAAAVEARRLPGEVLGSFERFVLDHGRPYESQELTRAERRIVDAAISEYRSIHRRFEPQHCFTNSQGLLANDETKTMVYVEGFAWTHTLRPALHGWLTINGKVIDVTLPPTSPREAKLREALQVVGEFTGRSYIGVPFLRSYVRRRRNETGGRGSLLDDQKNDYPLLRNGAVGAVSRVVLRPRARADSRGNPGGAAPTSERRQSTVITLGGESGPRGSALVRSP